MNCIEQWQPKLLYLAGDIIEQKYRQHRSGTREVARLHERLIKLKESGTTIIRLSGNHDERGLDDWDKTLGSSLPYVFHSAADGRNWLVVHGDIFDLQYGTCKSFISQLGSSLYPYLIGFERFSAHLLRSSTGIIPKWCTKFKLRVRRVRQHIRHYERYMTRLAKQHDCCGVICGHIHVPAVKTIHLTTYANCGDWIEHRSYLIETESGEILVRSA